MAIQVRGPGQEPESVAVTMRTPGHDFELAVGFLASEGLIAGRESIRAVRYCDVEPGEQLYNVVTVDLRVPFDFGFAKRSFVASSSCGICGKAALDQISVVAAPIPAGPVVARSVVAALPGALRMHQGLFEETGGLHAAGLFDVGGTLEALREDVGRHNAVDKVIGRAFLADELPLSTAVLLVSGRASFEIVQKAAVAGIPILCAVSAPSSLAVDAARRFGMTLVGFLRGERFNLYSHPERVDLTS